jgi:hypothetical protein
LFKFRKENVVKSVFGSKLFGWILFIGSNDNVEMNYVTIIVELLWLCCKILQRSKKTVLVIHTNLNTAFRDCSWVFNISCFKTFFSFLLNIFSFRNIIGSNIILDGIIWLSLLYNKIWTIIGIITKPEHYRKLQNRVKCMHLSWIH